MKKLIKIATVLFVAAAMFTGCQNNASSNDNGGELFSKNDVSKEITINDIKLVDGNWEASIIDKEEGSNYKSERTQTAKFTISDNLQKFTYTEMTMKGSESGKIPAEATEEDIKEYKEYVESKGGKFTQSGDSYTVTYDQTADAESLEKANAGGPMAILPFFMQFDKVLTNDDYTKYYAENSGTDKDGGTYKTTAYLMKK